MAGPNDFSTNYAIAVTLDGLQQLKELRAELQALRKEAQQPIDYVVNVSATSTTKGRAKATTSGGATSVTVNTDKLDQVVERLARAAEILSKGLETPKVKVDTEAIGKAVGEAVAREFAKRPAADGGGHGTTVTRPIADARRQQLKAEQKALGELAPRSIDKLTERDIDVMERTLEKEVNLLGGQLKKRFEAHIRAVRAAREAGMSAGTMHATTGSVDVYGIKEQVTSFGDDFLAEIGERNFKGLKKLMQETRTAINERYNAISRELESGVDHVVGHGSGGTIGGDLSALQKTIRISSRKIRQAIDSLTNNLSEAIGARLDQLAENIKRMPVGTLAGGAASAEPAEWEKVLAENPMPGDSRRRGYTPRPKKKVDPRKRIEQAARRDARREAKLTEFYERMSEAQRKRFDMEADAGRVYFESGAELGIPATLGGQKGLQGAVANLMRRGAGQLLQRAGINKPRIASTVTDQTKLSQEIHEAAVRYRETRGAARVARRTASELARQGDSEGAQAFSTQSQKLLEEAKGHVGRFRRLRDEAAVVPGYYESLTPEIRGQYFGKRGALAWDAALTPDSGRRMSPRRAESVAAAMLRSADELDRRAGGWFTNKQTGESYQLPAQPGIAIPIGQASYMAGRLGSASALLRNLQTGHKEFGKMDPKLMYKYERLRSDDFLQQILPSQLSPGNISGILSDVKGLQAILSDAAGMASMVSFSKRHGQPGRFNYAGEIKGGAYVDEKGVARNAGDLEFRAYPEDVKAEIARRMKQLEDMQFARTAEIKATDAPTKARLSGTREMTDKEAALKSEIGRIRSKLQEEEAIGGSGAELRRQLQTSEAELDNIRRRHPRLTRVAPAVEQLYAKPLIQLEDGEWKVREDQTVSYDVVGGRRAGPPARRRRPAQTYNNPQQISAYIDHLAAWLSRGGESGSGEFTGFHQINAVLERMGLPPVGAPKKGAGDAGVGNPPPPPPPDKGGPWNFGDMDPDKAAKFVAALRQLENLRLSGLATDLKEIAGSVNAIAKRTTAQPGLLRFLDKETTKSNIISRSMGRLNEIEAQAEANAIRDAEALKRAQLSAATRSTLGRVMGGPLRMATAPLPPAAGPEGGLTLEQLAALFVKQEKTMGTGQQRFAHLFNKYGIQGLLGGAGQGGTAKGLVNTAVEVDATRADMMNTLRKMGALQPEWFAPIDPLVGAYDQVRNKRMGYEKDLNSFRAQAGAYGPQLPPDMVARKESRLTQAIVRRRKEEDLLTQSILSRSSADAHALAKSEHHLTFVDRLVGKLQTLSAYMGAGAILWGTASILRNAFQGAVQFEREMAHIQGIVGNRTPQERDRLAQGILGASVQYGTPVSQVAATAKTFAQTGIGVERSLLMTQASLAGQLGAGLEPQQATEMLIAVDNITKSAVTAANILDRISRVEARFAVTAQDLSVAIQRVGSVATQLQPGVIGGTDALDLVMGASTAIVEKTRVTGNQAATSLRFMMARLLQPETARDLQQQFGIKLGGASGTELRPLLDIFHDIAKLYKELLKKDSGMAAQLLTTVGGARQVNAAAALFGNWDDVMRATHESARAWGDTQHRLSIQMETLGFQIDRTKAAFFGFMNALLQQTGIMAVAKVGTKLVGSALSGATPIAGFIPLITGLVLGRVLGPLAMRGAARLTPGVQARAQANAATASLQGYMPTAALAASSAMTPLLANLKSVFEVLGRWLPRIGGFFGGPIGIGLSALTLGGMGYRAYRRSTRPEMWDRTDVAELRSRLQKDEGVQAFGSFAAQNAMSPQDLTRVVLEAIVGTEADIYNMRDKQGRPQFPLKGTGFFGGSQTQPGLAEAATRRVVSRMTAAIPSLESLGAKEREAAVLQLINQTGLVTGGVAEAVRSSELEHLQQRQQELEKNIRAASTPGGMMMTPMGGGWTRAGAFAGALESPSNISSQLQRVFGTGMGGGIANLFLGDKNTSFARAMMQTGAENVGEAFDKVARESLQLSHVEAELTKKLRAGLRGQEWEVRPQLIDTLRGTMGQDAQTARLKLENVQRLEDSIFNTMLQSTPDSMLPPALKGQTGRAGTDAVMSTFKSAGERYAAELEKRSPSEAKAVRAFNKALFETDNRQSSFLEILNRGTDAVPRANARDRVLEVLAQFGVSNAVAVRGGGALQRAGFGFDVAAAQAQSSQDVLRGLISAEEQTKWDVPRAASQLARFNEMLALVRSDKAFKTFITDNAEIDEDGRRVIEGAFAASAGNLGGKSKDQYERRLRFAKDTLNALQTDPLFANLDPDARARIQGLTGVPEQVLAAKFPELIGYFEQLATLAREQVQAQQEILRNVQHEHDLREEVLKGQLAQSQMGRTFGIRYAEMYGGPGAALGLRAGDISAGASEQRAAAERLFGSRLRMADIQYAITGNAIQNAADSAVARNQRDIDITRIGNDEAARRAELLQGFQYETFQRMQQNSTQLVQSMTSGIRSNLVSYDTLKGPALAPRLYKPVIDTFSGKVVDSFTDMLVGPQGILGGQLSQMLNQTFLMESQLIRDAHITGITAGFAAAGYAIDPSKLPQSGALTTGGKLKALGSMAAIMGGTLLGGAVGTRSGVNAGKNYGSEGAQIGTMIGSMIPGIGPIVGPILGGLLGGFFGGRMGKGKAVPPELQALERIERNTRDVVTAIQNQTRMLTLDNRLIGVPASFVVPRYTIAAGGGMTVESSTTAGANVPPIIINVNGAQSPEATARAVEARLAEQLRGSGKFTSSRQP